MLTMSFGSMGMPPIVADRGTRFHPPTPTSISACTWVL